MATTSSLLRSALARRKEQADLEDKLVEFEWQSSAKTEDDWAAYVGHIQNRIQQTGNDISRQLTYQTKVRSATRAYTSAEIQREQINILEGNGTLQDKQQAIIDLYGLAVGNEDYDLAQNLRQQFDTINIQLQNQAQRGQRLASQMATTRSTEIKEHVNKLIYGSANKKGVRDDTIPSLALVNETFAKYGNERFNAISEAMMPMINEQRAAQGLPPLAQVGYWDVVLGIYDTVADTYLTGAEQLAGTSAGYSLLEEYNKVVGQAADGSEMKLEVAPGLNLTREQVVAAVNAERAGQPIYAVTQENGVTKFRERTLTDYVWGVDENGKYSLINVRETFKENLDKFTARDAQGNEIVFDPDEGTNEEAGPLQIERALRRLGINVESTEGGYFIQNPGNIEGLSGGEGINVVVSSDGRLRAVVGDFEGNQRLYELNFTGNGLSAREIEEGSAEATQMRTTDEQAINITKQLIGQQDNQDLLSPTENLRVSSLIGNTGANSTQLLGLAGRNRQLDEFGLPTRLTTNDILSGVTDLNRVRAAQQELRLQAQQAALPALNVPSTNLQQSSAPNLNQTAFPQLTDFGVKPLPTLPRLSVAPTPQPTQPLRVNTQTNQPQRLSVNTKPSYGSVLRVR